MGADAGPAYESWRHDSELIKEAGVRLMKLLPGFGELGMEHGTCPQREYLRGDHYLFKAELHSCQGPQRGCLIVNPIKMLVFCFQHHQSQATPTGSVAFRSKIYRTFGGITLKK
jgi:hypothetical protein